MTEQIFKKTNKQGAEKYKYFSAPFVDIYYPKKKNLIKNYLFIPDKKLVTHT